MKTLIALPTWPKAGSVAKAIEKANEYGFDYVEVSLDYPWPEGLVGKTLEEVREAKAKYGISLAFHAPWRDVALASPRQILRESSLKLYEICLEFAHKLEALYFNFHIFSKEAWSIPGVREKLEESAFSSVRKLSLKAGSLGLKIAIENNPEPLFGIPRMLKPFVEGDVVKLCLDSGHVAYTRWYVSQRDSDEFKEEAADLEEWVRIFKNKILVGHIHDYVVQNGKFRDHLFLGRGSSDLRKEIALLKESRCNMMLLEIHWLDLEKPAGIDDLGRALNFIKPWIK